LALTVTLNSIQGLFDEIKQKEAIAQFAQHGIKRFRVKHGMSTFCTNNLKNTKRGKQLIFLFFYY
jgi:hypothetical protein